MVGEESRSYPHNIHEKPVQLPCSWIISQTLRQRQPFQMFTVELNGGRRFEVDHPMALVVRDGVAVFIAAGGVPIWFDHENVNQIIGAPSDASA